MFWSLLTWEGGGENWERLTFGTHIFMASIYLKNIKNIKIFPEYLKSSLCRFNGANFWHSHIYCLYGGIHTFAIHTIWNILSIFLLSWIVYILCMYICWSVTKEFNRLTDWTLSVAEPVPRRSSMRQIWKIKTILIRLFGVWLSDPSGADLTMAFSFSSFFSFSH